MDSTNGAFFTADDLLHEYSRAQAIADGTLVDLNQGELGELVKEAGIKFPLTCTATVFASCIGLTPAAKRACNDINGRLWDVLTMLKYGIRNAKTTDRIEFTVMVVRERVRPTPTRLKAICGPGDNMEPVITLMFVDED